MDSYFDGYFDRRFDDSRDIFERRFLPMPPPRDFPPRDLGPAGLRGRDFLPPPPLPPRPRDALPPPPPPPPISLRGPPAPLPPLRDSPASREAFFDRPSGSEFELFNRRSPPSAGVRFRLAGLGGPSPPRRYTAY